MTDTLHAFLPIERIPCLNLGSLSRVLHGRREHRDEDGTIVESGSYKNLKVLISESGISFQGSLPKFYKGENIGSMTLIETRECIDKISDKLDLPFHDSDITRLDFGASILTDYIPAIYFPSLGEVSRLHRLVQPSSIYWKTKSSSRTLQFYDKAEESKKSRIPIPTEAKRSNIARFEVRYLKPKLGKAFNKNLRVADLTNKLVHNQIVDTWAREFQSIHKLSISELNLFAMKTPKDFEDSLINYGLQKLGYEAAMNAVDLLKAHKAFSGKLAYSRLRKRIRQAFDSKSQTQNPLITELNEKVRLIVNRSKNESYLDHI